MGMMRILLPDFSTNSSVYILIIDFNEFRFNYYYTYILFPY
jgi:hypothetical protein